MKPPKPPTEAQRAMLQSVADGKGTTGHLSGRAAHGASATTASVCYQRGWLVRQRGVPRITVAGLAALKGTPP